MNTYNVVISVSITVCIDAENHDDAIEKVSQALNSGDANMSADVASSIGYSLSLIHIFHRHGRHTRSVAASRVF